MLSKSIEQITVEDLQSLVDNAVIEGKTLEYKGSLPGDKDLDKKEFLADVSSFANTSGGDLILGIVEEPNTGIPKSVEGIVIDNVDQTIVRLESIIRDGIEPRIMSIAIKPVYLPNSAVAIIIRIPRSWASPHRVSFKGNDRFYSRGTNGKYPMDIGELRIAFNLSETIVEKIRNFKQDRLSRIFTNETPVTFLEGAKIVLHLIPLISFNPAQSYDINKITSRREAMTPIYCSGWNSRYNLDGLLTYSASQREVSHSYVQLYRNGIIEAVEGGLLEPYDKKLIIPSVRYEQELITSLANYLNILNALNVDLPILVFLSVLGVKGYTMSDNKQRFGGYDKQIIDRDALLLQEVIVDNYNTKAEIVLRPCFDSIWNACGFERSLNYNEAGKWAP
ncbi:MAG: ATP-binding protein [Dehalococcoidia bacterium]|jgi:hypothetical protein